MSKKTTSTEVPYAEVRDYIISISGDHRGKPIGDLLDQLFQSKSPVVRAYLTEKKYGSPKYHVKEKEYGVKIELTTENIKIAYECSTFSAEHTSYGCFYGSYSEKREEIKIKRKSGRIPIFRTILSKNERFPNGRGSLDLGNIDNVNLDGIVEDSLKVLVG